MQPSMDPSQVQKTFVVHSPKNKNFPKLIMVINLHNKLAMPTVNSFESHER